MGANKVDDRGGEPSLFGGPGEVVRSQRLTRIRKVSGRITGDQGIQEGVDESRVAATVTSSPLGTSPVGIGIHSRLPVRKSSRSSTLPSPSMQSWVPNNFVLRNS
jgi:hypothetical protein